MQIVDIIIILHSNGIVHCDLKLSNFVITPLLKVYLIDLDNSKFVGEFNDYGTLKYCSIDQINGSNVTYQFDIYALGIITYELLLNKKAFSNMNSEEIIEAKRKNNIILDKDLNKKLILKKIINKATDGLYNNIEEFKSDLLKLKRICGG